MPQFPHEEVAFESGINVRFTIYNSNNDYIPEHWHRSMEVIYIYEGSMELIEGQRVLLLHAGDYHVINSAAVHATRTTTPSRVLLLQIPYAFLIGAIPEYESIRFLFSHRDSSADAQIQEILTSMGDLYTKKPQSYTLRFSGLLYDFLYILMTHYKVTVDNTSRIQSQKNLHRLEPVIQYIQSHYTEVISLENAASLAHLNPEYFCRFFRRNMGTTLTSYINSVRLTHVCKDLKDSVKAAFLIYSGTNFIIGSSPTTIGALVSLIRVISLLIIFPPFCNHFHCILFSQLCNFPSAVYL